ncbi:MAG: energy transducer TonB [Arcobacteraceae bacterium]
MNSYTKSFGITAVIYLLLSVSVLYSFDTQKILQNRQIKSENNVQFTIIQEEKVKEKIVEKKKEEKLQKVVKKKIPPKVKTKKIKPIEKKIIKKVEKKIVKKQPLHKKPINQSSQVIKNQIKKNKSILTQKKHNLEELNKRKVYQKKYYAQIKELINKNKYYPKRAVQRGIEGIVEIRFTISKYGELISFEIVEGKRIFKKSIQNAVEKSFPLKPPADVLSKNTQLSLKVAYNLY